MATGWALRERHLSFFLAYPTARDCHTWQVPHLDKVYHGIGYAGLTLLLLYALGLTFVQYPSTHLAVWGVVLAISYGALNEFQQSFTPVRTMSVADGVANALGAGIAVWMWPTIQRWWLKIMTRYGRGTRSLPRTASCCSCGALGNIPVTTAKVD